MSALEEILNIVRAECRPRERGHVHSRWIKPWHIVEWLDRRAGGVTVSERERAPSAVEVTVEEWEALEKCVREFTAPWRVQIAAGEALRKLNARAAISKSETTAAYAERETAWLVEREKPGFGPRYLCFDMLFDWGSHARALRFTRREDAEAMLAMGADVAAEFSLGPAVVTEHEWVPRPVSKSSPGEHNPASDLRNAGESAAPQPESSGGGEGDEASAMRLYLELEGFRYDCSWSGLSDVARRAWISAFRFARELGAVAEIEKAKPVIAAYVAQGTELQEKLAAAETEKTELERRCLAFMTAHHAAEERAEKAEAERDGLRAKVEAQVAAELAE